MQTPSPADAIAAVTHPDPYSWYAALLRDAPIRRSGTPGLWLVLGADAVEEALRLPAGRVRPPAEPVPRFLLGTFAGEVFAEMARMNDGPRHATQRERVLALIERISGDTLPAIAQHVADALAVSWRRQADGQAMDRFVQQLPVTVMAAAIGLPERDWATAVAATADWVAGLSPLADDAAHARGIEAMAGLRLLLKPLGVDSTPDVAAHVALLMQPHDATAGLIGAGVLRFIHDPALWSAAHDPQFPWDRFAAEVLRFDPPVHNTRRVLAADARLCGQSVQAGDTLLIVLAAAERDPARHDEPHRFRLDRPARDSLQFGAGPHACPGARMATAIAVAGWRALLSSDSIEPLTRLASDVRWRPSVNARVPVFSPA
jgi:cytochrome P450